MQEKTRLYALIHGHVQGVGFRWFVQKTAARLDITGWVRNLSNGDVELEAEGNRDHVSELITRLQHDHPWAQVQHVSSEQRVPLNREHSFEIRF